MPLVTEGIHYQGNARVCKIVAIAGMQVQIKPLNWGTCRMRTMLPQISIPLRWCLWLTETVSLCPVKVCRWTLVSTSQTWMTLSQPPLTWTWKMAMRGKSSHWSLWDKSSIESMPWFCTNMLPQRNLVRWKQSTYSGHPLDPYFGHYRQVAAWSKSLVQD